MSDKLPMVLLALGFALAGSVGTAIGFTLAQRSAADSPTVGETPTAADTDLPPTARRAAARGARMKAVSGAMGSPRSRGKAKGRAAERGRSQRAEAGPRGQGRSWAVLAEGLDINEEQQQAWQKMMDDIRSDCVATRLGQEDTTLELMVTAVSQQDASSEDLHAQVESSLEARREASHCVLDEVLEFRSQLTPEQRLALGERVGKLKERRKAWLEAWSDKD